MEFNYEDTKFYADKLRGHCNTSGPWWSTLLRFVPMFDEVTRLQSSLTVAQEENKRLKIEITASLNFIEDILGHATKSQMRAMAPFHAKYRSALNGGK